jgi:hypothetical protein
VWLGTGRERIQCEDLTVLQRSLKRGGAPCKNGPVCMCGCSRQRSRRVRRAEVGRGYIEQQFQTTAMMRYRLLFCSLIATLASATCVVHNGRERAMIETLVAWIRMDGAISTAF